jgi:Xaa-Pro dipeptidase
VNTEHLTDLYTDHLDQLTARYAQALATCGYDAVVVHSGSPKKRTEFDDQYWPLRVTPHFQHWLPLAEPECALVIAPGKRPKLIWNKQVSVWEKPAPAEGRHWQAAFDIAEVTTLDAMRAELPKGKVAFVGQDRWRAASWGFAEDDVSPKALIELLDQARTLKSQYEVACLAEANLRAAAGHRALEHAFRSGDASELDLHLLFLRATGQDDPETPYKNIVALGENAATLHHVSYGRTAQSSSGGQALLVDAGATFMGYCSDITRTHVKDGDAAASTFAGLVASVERLQQALCAAVAVGDKYEALHNRAHREIADALRDAGVLRLSTDEAVAGGVTRTFFPHGLGHSLGLQCHDVGCALVRPQPSNPFLRNTSTIAEGQCFTIEPGVYFIEPLLEQLRQGAQAAAVEWELVGELRKFGGVRIEDDLIVTGGEHVARNLTREVLPR